MNPYLNLLFNFLEAVIKCFVAGYIFALIAPEIKKAWVKQKKWKLAYSVGALFLAYYILFLGLIR